ncbi:MAG: polyprenyl synthetase family protein [Actinomycetota bacterium]
MSFSPTFEELRAAVDDELKTFLSDRAQALGEAQVLVDEIGRMLDAGGKRIRPLFCYWGFRSAGGTDGPIVRSAASLELLHTFAIVHDDIMDASDERRGVTTVHVRHGVEVALLVGDLALVLADELFTSAQFPPDRVLAAFGCYSRMRQEVIAGQLLDHQAASQPITEERARRIAVLKSGRYSVEEPLLIGAALAGASEETLASLARFGAPLGEAFQLRDDLLGTFGDRTTVGKPVDSDIREGKRNVLFAKTIVALAGEERRFFEAHWGAGARLTDAEVDRLRSLVESSGARAQTEALLQALASDAGAALAALETDDEARTALVELMRLAVGRHA